MLVSHELIALASSKLNFRSAPIDFWSPVFSLASWSSFPLEGWNEFLDVEIFDHLLEYWVVSDINLVNLNLRFLWDEVKLLFSFLFLESEWNASDGSLLNSLHQVSGITSDLVSKSLGLNHTDIIDDSLVDMEIIGQPSQKHDQLEDSDKYEYIHQKHLFWVRSHW